MNRRTCAATSFSPFFSFFDYMIKKIGGWVPYMKLLRPAADGENVLLHICCAPDASYGVPAMQEKFRVAGFFFNPNIHPSEEYERRLNATRKLQDFLPFPLEVLGGGDKEWDDAVRGLEGEPERGRRCEECIRVRLRRTANEAKLKGFKAFCTVLTVSPKKDAAMVNRIGREEGELAGVFFIEADMKKCDGFRKSVEISKKLGIYRQDYCGCRYSARK
jgi:predicted adenine nucleotide alpha hydrolase (AANH) superfamily ATPase